MNMMNMMNMLMVGIWDVWHGWLKYLLLAVMAICAIFVILVVIFQPGNSSGIGALGGQTETFLGKNKSKTFEHRMRKLTIISSSIFAVLCIVFTIVSFFISQG
jgi:preprotein translocase subunit SecG